MDKRAKKPDRPKLRKEDIGTPVNFVHVQHVGFGQKSKSQSACTSPSFDNMDPFFNQQNIRTSSMGNGKLNSGKENRLSNVPLPPYSSMTNLSILSNAYEKESGGTSKFSGIGKQKTTKTSFSGSLLNLNFFPFSKSSSTVQDRSKGSKNDQVDSSIRVKRLSLGVGFSANSGLAPFLPNRPLTGPPDTPPPPPTQKDAGNRPHIRRRSSSFNESDSQGYTRIMGPPAKPTPVSLTLNRHLQNSNKKQKMGSVPPHAPYSPPPLSPNYDELPPPPDMSFSSSSDDPCHSSQLESPSHIELNLPPPMSQIVPRKMSFSRPSEFPMPPPPSPPSNIRRKLSAVPATPNDDLPPPPSPPSTPPPLPTSPPPINMNRVGYKFHPLKTKLIRVNAPTLPPLSVPLVRCQSQSPGTPSTWPLEPGIPQLFEQIDQDEVPQDTLNFPVELEPYPIGSPELNLSISQIQQAFNHNSTCVDFSHVEPLSKLFQCRLSYQHWPIMMNKLFSNSKGAGKEIDFSKDAAFVKNYNDLIQNTLNLWLKLEGGRTTLENVVAVFEQTQEELLQHDCGDNITKL